ncbi:transferase, chloramphenicol acetyltransferase-like domain protein [Tanacetum coccineum]
MKGCSCYPGEVKQPLHIIERSLPTSSLVTTKRPYESRRLFSANPRVILQELSTENEIEHKSTGGIRVMSIQNVKPDRPTPDALRSYKLSAFDQINAPSYVPFIFFYPNNSNGNTNINGIILQRSKLLKQSMSETLTRFYPFAGKYTNDIHIDCNDEGVYYVETQVDCDLSSFLAKPDYKLIPSLLPVPPNGKEPTLGYYLVMIQVNFFSCGGVAISMSNSHKLIDGGTYTTFLNSWASAAKGDKQNIIYPNFVSSSLFLPNTKTNSYPYFPLSFLTVKPMVMNKGKCVTKRFRFDASALQTLKAKANEYVSATRVIAVTSLIWKCATSAARKLNGERLSILHIAVNLRGRFATPLPQNAIGNIIWNGVARCEPNHTLILDTIVIDEIRSLGAQMTSYDADYYLLSSMCNSGMCEADFGWGKPVWSCFGYFNNDVPLYWNAIMLLDTSTGDGIEAWVTLSQDEMAILEGDPDLLRYKARLVANGSMQLDGVDVDETFSLVVKPCTIQTSSFYGLKQAPWAWFQRFAASITQCKYATEILERAHMVSCNYNRTPVDTESKLGDDGDLCSSYFSSSTTSLVAYSDADLADCPITRRLTSSYCVFFDNNLLSWSSKRQPTLSHSSVEAKYRRVANVVAEICWLRNLLRELHTPLSSATLVYCDNVSAVYLSSNLVQHQRPSMSSAYLSRSSSIITSQNEPQAALAPEFQGMANQSYTGDSQLRVIHDNDQVNPQLPSYSSAFPRGGNSTTSGFLSSDNRSAVHEAAPGVDGFGRGNASQPSINGNNGENHANAPTFTANGRENISNIPKESTNAAPVNPQDVVGISLVGRRFKDVNPTAYYVERN